jgi:hypothetical protein
MCCAKTGTPRRTAKLLGVSLSTVNRRTGPKPAGGRQHENMAFEEKKAFLTRFTKAAGAGMLAKCHRIGIGL